MWPDLAKGGLGCNDCISVITGSTTACYSSPDCALTRLVCVLVQRERSVDMGVVVRLRCVDGSKELATGSFACRTDSVYLNWT